MSHFPMKMERKASLKTKKIKPRGSASPPSLSGLYGSRRAPAPSGFYRAERSRSLGANEGVMNIGKEKRDKARGMPVESGGNSPGMLSSFLSDKDIKIPALMSPRKKSVSTGPPRHSPRELSKRSSSPHVACASERQLSGKLEMLFDDNTGDECERVRYWFFYAFPRLFRFAHRTDTLPVGVILLTNDMTVLYEGQGKKFSITLATGERFEFKAQHPAAAEKWATALRTAVSTDLPSSSTRSIGKGGLKKRNAKLAKVFLTPRELLLKDMPFYESSCNDVALVEKYHNFSRHFLVKERGVHFRQDCIAWFLFHCTFEQQINQELHSFLLCSHKICPPDAVVALVKRVWENGLQKYPYGVEARLKNFLRQYMLAPLMSEDKRAELAAKKDLLHYCANQMDGVDRKTCLALLDLVMDAASPAIDPSMPPILEPVPFSHCGASALAQLLTELDEGPCSRLQLSEFADMRWQKNKLLAPNLAQLTDNFNNVSSWVANKVLTGVNEKKRTAAYVKFVRVAKHLMDIRNYNTAAAVICGLTKNPVERLKHIQDALPPRIIERLQKLRSKVSPERNFAEYRALPHESPCIPFFAVYLRDLTFAHEGNAMFYDTSKTVINFETVEQVGACLRSLSLDKEQQYCFQYDPEHLRALKVELSGLPDDELLYEMSLGLERTRSSAASDFSPATSRERAIVLNERLSAAEEAQRHARMRALAVVREGRRVGDDPELIRDWLDGNMADFSKEELLDMLVQVVALKELDSTVSRSSSTTPSLPEIDSDTDRSTDLDEDSDSEFSLMRSVEAPTMVPLITALNQLDSSLDSQSSYG